MMDTKILRYTPSRKAIAQFCRKNNGSTLVAKYDPRYMFPQATLVTGVINGKKCFARNNEDNFAVTCFQIKATDYHKGKVAINVFRGGSSSDKAFYYVQHHVGQHVRILGVPVKTKEVYDPFESNFKYCYEILEMSALN